MRYWSRIRSRADALRVIESSATVFFLLAAFQVFAAAMIFFASRDIRYYARLPSDGTLNYLATAVIVVALTTLMRVKQSRVAAVSLVLLLTAICATSFYAAAYTPKTPAGNASLAALAIIFALRATYATFKAHGKFAEIPDAGVPLNRSVPPERPAPQADFISHPTAGVESATATAARKQAGGPYDKQKWAALLKYDDEIAIVANRIRRLGKEWEDELARAYLALNDKSYLARIENKIYADARAEAVRSRL
jgi:hypothetical protein